MDKVNKFMSNPYFAGAVTVIAIFYGSLARPELPHFLHNLFDNPIFRFFILTLIAWIGSKNIQVALIVAVVFMITINLLSEQKLSEGFVSYALETFTGDAVVQESGAVPTEAEIAASEKEDKEKKEPEMIQ